MNQLDKECIEMQIKEDEFGEVCNTIGNFQGIEINLIPKMY